MRLSLVADLTLAATAVMYAIASVLFFQSLAGRGPHAARRGTPFLGIAAVIHLSHFLLTSFVSGACPVEGIHQATNLAALVAAALFWLTSRFARIDVVGAFVAPVCLAALIAARLVFSAQPSPPIRTAILPLHVTAILLSSALFAVASALAATYLLQERHLKSKSGFGLLQKLPPLDVLDRASYRLLLAGFPLLTLGILTGLLWIGQIRTGQLAMLRQVFSGVAWATFAAVLLLRSAGFWRGRRAAWGTIVGFSAAVLVFVVYLVRDARVG